MTGDALEPFVPDAAASPPPDPDAEPQGFVVDAGEAVRVHFLDWRGSPRASRPPAGAVLLVPGLLEAASAWATVARRLARVRSTVAVDLRGQGLSDAPTTGYDLDRLAEDVIAVAEGSGVLDAGRVTVAGHGFGGIVGAAVAGRLGERCESLVLVDGGWERLEATTGLDIDEFLRGLDEPPEVMRSMTSFVADRRSFDPATWDADQEAAARDTVVETAAGRVVRAVRPHVVDALARTMFGYDPAAVLPGVSAPVAALVALAGAGSAGTRIAELRRTAEARLAAGGGPVRVALFPSDSHNLMRYRPGEVTATILAGATIPPG